jgi:cytochrome c
MKLLAGAAVLSLIALPVFADGDADKGEKAFKKCKSCHTIQNGVDVIVKGGKTGPNLYGVVGRAVASTDFAYSEALKGLGGTGMVWTAENIENFIKSPNDYVSENGGSGRSKMSFKLAKGGDDIAAYLESVVAK